MNLILKLLLSIIILGFSTLANAQDTTRIELLGANSLEPHPIQGSEIKRLIGDVVLRHQNTLLLCDSAYKNDFNNEVEAFGNVFIKSDSLLIWGDYLKYFGDERIAELHNNVELRDSQITLFTDYLQYDLENDIGLYTGGGEIIDDDNNLVSKSGYYYANVNEFFFKNDVVLVNPKYEILTDTLKYNTDSEVAYFFGPCTITSEENLIYCENGWYDTKSDLSQFSRNAYLNKNEQTIHGDSLVYNRKSGIGKAYENVLVVDTIEKVWVEGHYGLYYDKEKRSVITDSAIATIFQNNDTTFIHADQLIFTFDSTNKSKDLFAYHEARFFHNDFQGMTDSLVHHFKDSIMYFYKDPVLWSDNYQMSADTISILLKRKKIDKMFLKSNTFIIMDEGEGQYSQVKGDKMIGYFKNGSMKKLNVYNNCETIYFIFDEQEQLTGINKATSTNISMFFENKSLKTVSMYINVVGKVYPDSKLVGSERELEGFSWQIEKRPRTKLDIFK